MFGRTVVIIILLLGSSLPGPAQTPVMLGVLEQVSTSRSQAPVQAVRVLFESDGEDWRALATDCPDYDCSRPLTARADREAIWTISSEGRNLGQVRSRIPAEFDIHAALGRQMLISKPSTPGLRNANYGGSDEPAFHPLVATSRSYVGDPDEWKPSSVSSDIAKAVRKTFRDSYSQVHRCETDQPLVYRDSDIQITAAYASKFSWHLVEVTLEGCAGTEDGDKNLRSQWFAVNGANQAELVGEDIELVGSGDYDNDGSSELVFSVTGENRNGYELFYDDFRGHVTLTYSIP
jgi:hypothetical protein